MPWNNADKLEWFKEQIQKSSSPNDVSSKVQNLRTIYELSQYGTLSLDPALYPLWIIKSKVRDAGKKTVLITGGVHGYETSGILGALAFMTREARRYADRFNFICAPCISPWGYETINRWSHQAIDPNRSFHPNSPVEECALFLNAISTNTDEIFAHFDLHETTDTDNTVFRPALERRDGKIQEKSEIPDGFYTVGDIDHPCFDFQRAIIESVRKVTHIAQPDQEGRIIGTAIQQEGVINYPLKKLSLCAGFSNAKFTTTTEVYPDSPRVTDAICVEAQIAAIQASLTILQVLLELNWIKFAMYQEILRRNLQRNNLSIKYYIAHQYLYSKK